MLKNIQKNKDKWPNIIQANLPHKLQSAAIRDSDVRSYMRDGEQLVTALGKLQKGVVGKYKLEQIERGKINVNQPIESQIEGLEDILAMADIEDAKQKYINSTKDTHGHYPLDIETKIA